MVSAGSEIVAYLCAGLGDCLYVLLGVGIASLTSNVFGTLNYNRIFSYIAIIGAAVGSVGDFIIGSLYQGTGSFEAVFIFCIITILVIIVLVVWARNRGEKLPHETKVIGENAEDELLDELGGQDSQAD
ncbi:MAG: hypothetical protein LUB61_07670 [Eggerthellaceae bacterium]|nr:hypothetical protein [Eggerthellaceae bacterium]